MSGDIFDIDQGDKETITGTLHDPAATTGHVLTVQADKSVKAAAGGGSQPAQITENGVLGVVTVPAGTPAVIIDPSPQDWQAHKLYSPTSTPVTSQNATIHKVGDPSFTADAIDVGFGVSGGSEPAWSTDGSLVNDHQIQWAPFPYAGAWAALTSFPASHIIAAAGAAWVSDGGGPSGASEPDWSGIDFGGTVSDGAITWTKAGAATTWQADTRYGAQLNPDAQGIFYDYVLPTTPAGWIFQWDWRLDVDGVTVAAYGESGATEPAWFTGGYTIDGDLIWSNPGSGVGTAAVTGLSAPGGGAVVSIYNGDPIGGGNQVNVIDVANTPNYQPQVQPGAGEGFNNNGSDVNLVDGHKQDLAYVASAWQGYS